MPNLAHWLMHHQLKKINFFLKNQTSFFNRKLKIYLLLTYLQILLGFVGFAPHFSSSSILKLFGLKTSLYNLNAQWGRNRFYLGEWPIFFGNFTLFYLWIFLILLHFYAIIFFLIKIFRILKKTWNFFPNDTKYSKKNGPTLKFRGVPSLWLSPVLPSLCIFANNPLT